MTPDTWASTPPNRWMEFSLLCRRAQAHIRAKGNWVLGIFGSEAGAPPWIPELKSICSNNIFFLPTAVFCAYLVFQYYYSMRKLPWKGRQERKRGKRTRNLALFIEFLGCVRFLGAVISLCWKFLCEIFLWIYRLFVSTYSYSPITNASLVHTVRTCSISPSHQWKIFPVCRANFHPWGKKHILRQGLGNICQQCLF